jgi:aminoglycoside 6'-N-acetyltransferase
VRPGDQIAAPSYHRAVDQAFDRLLTPRLVVRRFTAADAPAFARYRSDPDVARYQSWNAPFPLEQAQAFIAWLVDRHPDEPGEWYQVAIASREQPDRLLGDCGFRSRTDEPGIVDLGYSLAAEAQGHGYATEAVGEVLRYLFEDRHKHKVCADCDTRNRPSWQLLERLGFAREGELRESFRDADGWASEYLYGLLAPEWRANRDLAPHAGASAQPAVAGRAQHSRS